MSLLMLKCLNEQVEFAQESMRQFLIDNSDRPIILFYSIYKFCKFFEVTPDTDEMRNWW